MKRPVLLLALFCATTVHADDAVLEALCAASGGQVKRTDISNVRRIDCVSAQVSWFRIQTTTGEGRSMVNYEASRAGTWQAAIEAATADLTKLCGAAEPNIQSAGSKITASCRSAPGR